MRHAPAFSCAFALCAAGPAFADIILGAATGHISGSVSDFSGVDSFTLDPPLIVPGDDSHSDFAASPGQWTTSGAALLTTITTTLIDLRGFTDGTTSAPTATISALAEIEFTFTVTEATLVDWSIFTLTDPGTFAFVSLSGPGGEVPQGVSTLDPGVYAFSGSTGYAGLALESGDGTQFARFIVTLEVVPAPGAMALLSIAGLLSHPRRMRRMV